MASANPVFLADRFLETLRRTLAIEKIGSYIGVPDELENLRNIILATRPVLDDSPRLLQRERGQFFLMYVQDVLHEADDVVDELRTEILLSDLVLKRRRDPVITNVCAIIFPLAFNNVVFRQKFERIRGKTGVIMELRMSYFPSPTRQSELNPKSLLDSAKHGLSSAVGSRIIGREDDLVAIVEDLVGFYPGLVDQHVSITSVVGSAGTGKTVLAELAFNHERIVKQFGSMRIWVKVSGAFDAEQIADSIVKSVSGWRRAQKDMLEEEIAGRKYLLVLDDVRSIDREKWLDFKRYLMKGAEGSRVLLTTRSKEVAVLVDSVSTHLLTGLNEGDSWRLLSTVSSLEEVPPQLWEIVTEIVRKCRGVPLIIRRVGTILREFGTEDLQPLLCWCAEQLAYILSQEDDHFLQTLISSVNPFLPYCSLFPKGHEIDVQTLIKLWVAQGLMHNVLDTSQNLEDEGYDHFKSLIGVKIFEIVESDVWGKVTKCKMSDATHDLATAVAGKECLTLARDQDHQDVRNVPHHVSFIVSLSSPGQIPTSFHADTARIRSILFPCQSSIEGSSSKEICDLIISKMKFLRTLDLHNSEIETVPDHIGELKHLRYLDLSKNAKIKVLPESITRLLNLQTLKLSLCLSLKELPKDIKNLINLRHLEIDGCINLTHMPRGLGQLTQLQTLSQFVLSKDALPFSLHHVEQLKELSSLNNLRGELQIKNLQGDMDVASAHLEQKRFLQSLALDWEVGTMVSGGHEALVRSLKPLINLGGLTLSGYRGDEIPNLIHHNKLVKLVLRRCPSCRSLPPLHSSPSLKVLVLEDMAKLEYVLPSDCSSFQAKFFPSLQELRLIELPLLRSWWEEGQSNESQMFPCLSELFIYDCPKLVSMPRFPFLEEGLVLDSCSFWPFQETLKMTIKDLQLQTSTAVDEASSSTSVNTHPASFLPLSKLKKLFIVGIKEFNKETADEIMWKNLKSLQYLRLDYIQSLESLPDGLRCLTSLQEFHIWRCSFKALPEWIADLNILETLSIWICSDLKALPGNMRNLTSLRTLEIEDCPTLFHRCQRDVGVDWEKISHVRDLRIRLSSRK